MNWVESVRITLRRGAATLVGGVRDLAGSRSAWRRHKRQVDRAFDARFGVRTGGVTHLSRLSIASARRCHGVDHIAVDPDEMQSALASLGPIDPTRFTFVDLGSGKGRALLMAARLPFRRIIGVEFAPALHRQAIENVRRMDAAVLRCCDIQFACVDAASYVFPTEPLVVFMYNPFGLDVMREVAARLMRSLDEVPREVHVLYANPFHAGAWVQAGFVERVRGDTYALLGARNGHRAVSAAH